MSPSDSWSRHNDPMQHAPPTGATPTQHSLSETPRLPRNIRAVKDANAKTAHGRTLIVCLDGTGDKFDADNSSIVHFVSCLKKDDSTQLSYYQSGIGTYDGKGLSNGLNAAVDMAVGSGLGTHIRDAYCFLMQTYRDGDRICLFGFSRGAYTARCLAGMIHKVGLLPAHNGAQVPFAYQYYKDDSVTGWQMSEYFKRTFCTDVNVYFVGVFDSVASVGFIPRKLPLSSTPSNKSSYFRHAMALDERRAKFKLCRFKAKDHKSPAGEWKTVAEDHEQDRGMLQRLSPSHRGPKQQLLVRHVDDVQKHGGGKNAAKHSQSTKETDVLEVWFAGCHADVGGGAVKNEVRHKLSQIPLRWMIRQCFECETGILFNAHGLAEEGLDVDTLWPEYKKPLKNLLGRPPSLQQARYESGVLSSIPQRSSALERASDHDPDGLFNIKMYDDGENGAEHWMPEQVKDYFDAISPMNDQLAVAKIWWLLELWPIKVRVQRDDSWVKKVRMNLGRYRPVQEHEPNLHWTVHQRTQAKECNGYRVKARVDSHASWRIVA